MRRSALSVLALVPALAACGGTTPAVGVPGGDRDRGEELIHEYGCGSCHVIPGLEQADGRVGPSLAGFEDERYIAGRIPNTADNVIEWIQDPQRLEPGTIMPDLGVAEDEARDIAAYLYCCTG